MISKREIGKNFEDKAALFLSEQGYQVLDRNVNYRWGEIDVIAIDVKKNELVFVEVRHRAENSMTSPEESVSPAKQLRLKRAIETYLVNPRLEIDPTKLKGIRIDLIAFDGLTLNHRQNFLS